MNSAYLDDDLCALNAEDVPVFSYLQAAMDQGQDRSIGFPRLLPALSELKSTALVERKSSLQGLLKNKIPGLRCSEYVANSGPLFRANACNLRAPFRSGLDQ